LAGSRFRIKFQEDLHLTPSLDITPSQLELTLAEIVQKITKMTPQLIERLSRGLHMKSNTVVPEEVEILTPPAGRFPGGSGSKKQE